ncbi:hypothetical protein H7H51_03375 [Mycolicibacterium farcinogenes]|nr:hypothetical protein [Mycolicibacterium farcinogenes]
MSPNRAEQLIEQIRGELGRSADKLRGVDPVRVGVYDSGERRCSPRVARASVTG